MAGARRSPAAAALRLGISGFFRIAALLSLGFLIYEQLHETGATITAVASDPKDPFLFPFAINNNSHLFVLRDLAWSCAVHVRAGQDKGFDRPITGSYREIAPGQSLNINCAPPDRNGDRVAEASVAISLQYNTDIFGLYRWRRAPPPTRFTWLAGAANPQWVRGAFAK